MPRRVDIAWGRSGFIVRGFGQTNEQFNATHERSSSRLVGGTIFSDAQFAELARHLQFDATSILEHPVKAQLDVIREFTIKALLYADQKPKPVSVHRALELLIHRLASFLAAIERLDRSTLENFRLEKTSTVDRPTAFHVFISLPGRLHDVAAAARQAARLASEADLLVVLSDSAQRLAEVLHFLDGESQNIVLRNLQWTSEYHVRSMAEIVIVVRRTLLAAEHAWRISKKRGGQKPIGDFNQTVAWLAELYEACGGRFTHNPYEHTIYHGVPRSAAGRFVLAFVRICDPGIKPQKASTLMARFISARSKRRRTLRETSI
jgi:hypothetical protein